MSKGMPNDIIATTTPTISNVPLAETSPAVIDGGELPFVSTLSPQNKPTTTADCVIGGCSSQLCLDVLENDMVTTCEWREHYACYRTAVCEPQINGHCGWTKDKEFTQCLVEKEVM
jgi:eight-cysteine-cluster-containing protein